MSRRQVIVDGSNLATEGRSLPSLEQLDQAVREFISENPDDQVTVVVDASFGHRIDPRELPTFEEAEAAGEVVSPPAGAIGRGDAFLLRIAQKTGATVLSNDSFQEFHAQHPWLFDKGRLVGGKPVPGVGWIFMERTPVRGPKSREVIKEARRRKDTTDTESSAEGLETEAGAEPAGRKGARLKQAGVSKQAGASKQRSKTVDRAIETATHEVVDPSASGSRRPSRPPAEPVNEPLAFISFIASHPLGSLVDGVVLEYSSHGAFVEADGARCYVPLSAMGDPAPRSAREVMGKGEVVSLVVQALDPQRRGIELAMPGHEHVAGSPTPETVQAVTADDSLGASGPVPVRRTTRRRPQVGEEQDASTASGTPTVEPAAKKAPARKAATRGAAAQSDGVAAEAGSEQAETSLRPAKRASRAAKSSTALSEAGPVEAALGEAGPVEAAPVKKASRTKKSAPALDGAAGVAKSSGASKSAGVSVEPSKALSAKKSAALKPAAKASKASAKVPAEKTPATKRRSAVKEPSRLAEDAPRSSDPVPAKEGSDGPVTAAAARKSPPRTSATLPAKAAKAGAAVKTLAEKSAIKSAKRTQSTATASTATASTATTSTATTAAAKGTARKAAAPKATVRKATVRKSPAGS